MSGSKTSLGSLTKSEVQALSALYETEGYQALKKLMEVERLNIAKLSMSLQGSAEALGLDLRYLQGQAFALKSIHQTVKAVHGDDKKKEVETARKETRREALEVKRTKRNAS